MCFGVYPQPTFFTFFLSFILLVYISWVRLLSSG